MRQHSNTRGRPQHPIRRLAVLLVVLAALGSAATAEVVDIDDRQLQELLKRGVTIVDVRTPREWRQTGVIEGSLLLTFFDEHGRYDLQRFAQEITALAPRDQPVIVICRTGSRTGSIAPWLDQKVGYAVVYNVRHGITGWIGAGGRTTTVGLPPGQG